MIEYALNLTGEESLNKFLNIVKLFPECNYAYIMVGCNYRENYKYKKAIPYFEKAIELNNIYTGLAYAELGFCYEMLGKLKTSKAEDCYKKSIEINPENPIAKYYKLKTKYKNKFLRPIVDKMVILTFILAVWFPFVKNALKYTARYAENIGNILLYKSAIIIMWIILLMLFILAICDFITFVLIKLKIIK